jgi:adenosylcobinamide kinase/adenosylcobinamide-phosphate guanylyltransferase
MNLHLVTGGVRSGKSRFAQALAARLGGTDVTFIATAQALDDEMQQRIALHRSQRPAGWQTIESPRDVHDTIEGAAHGVILLDCLTLLASNAFLANAADYAASQNAVTEEIDRLLKAAAKRSGVLIAVTNEVGLGIVPEHPLGRWFRDALGTANQSVAEQAETVTLLVSGIPLRIKG